MDFDAVSSTSLTINKEMFGTFALLALVLMLWIRFRYGPGLWNDRALKSTYSALGILTALAAIVNGSLGGEAGLLGTALSEVWDFFGIDPGNPMVLSTAGGVTFLVVMLVAFLGVAVIATLRRVRRRAMS